jgi:hypothetical protein
MIVSIGFLLLVLSSFSAIALCQFFGKCKFGKYQAELILTDAKTHKPLINRSLTPTVISGIPSISRTTEEGQLVRTDKDGRASIRLHRE